MAARHSTDTYVMLRMIVVLAGRKLMTYVYAVGIIISQERVISKSPAVCSGTKDRATPENDYKFFPIDDAAIGEPLFQRGSVLPEDPIPAVSLQEIPPKKEESGADDDNIDPTNLLVNPEENPEDPPVIIIESNDEKDVKDEEWEEQEVDNEEELEDLVKQEECEYQEDDPEEILFDEGDWNAKSDVFYDDTTE
ncbi:hypothetical protein TIFTF001_029829 [Ficus carica]|uniref:Uncharacterized protein n=1 Tax=Ficus carica TaxID=3494 RepID=A0AA88DT47_FICCA|nr:hypothetical protein TIFTF001_029829 [Ficus carica]